MDSRIDTLLADRDSLTTREMIRGTGAVLVYVASRVTRELYEEYCPLIQGTLARVNSLL